jgi:signal transduction histidine kinase
VRTEPGEHNTITVDIKDTGVGIPPEAQGKVFRIGFSDWKDGTKGSGLGLYVVRRNIENHQGRVRMNSVVGTGTTVMVQLPAHSEEVSSAPTSA